MRTSKEDSMKASLKLLALGVFLVASFGTAYAQAPSLSTIPNISVNAGLTATVNVVAVDVGGRPITLTSALPSLGTLNTTTSGAGVEVAPHQLCLSAGIEWIMHS